MAKLDKLPKIDLTLLKRLVSQLEKELDACERIKNDETGELVDFIIEMSKSAGLVTGIIQESSLLIGDIQSIVKVSQHPGAQQSKPSDYLEKILGGLKGSGNSFN